ncbi:endonuclease/exonuclease/phosphatase family protein [Pedobacter helvus]|uniref:Endonuclease/exonuclease/phosphatase family protein n=2 Tax=Pedobacter helvus TaxID=2563444 RepID=A0ABW9JEF6_9SPHI
MKKYFVLCTLTLCSLVSFAQSFKLATYNLRYNNPKDTGNLWVDRKEIMADLIKKHDFDIFSTQEGKPKQLRDLIEKMPNYSWSGIDKEGNGTDEFCAIFYKKNRFELIDNGHFWLSETPEVPTKGWDAKYKRVCSWVFLKDQKTQQQFYVFDTHFDHKGMLAQTNSAKLIISKIAALQQKHPVILCGDFNFDRTNSNYKVLAKSIVLKDAFKIAKRVKSRAGSYNGFDINSNPESPIDHIFVSGPIEVLKYAIIKDNYSGKLPSDHYPVLAEMNLSNDKAAKTKNN